MERDDRQVDAAEVIRRLGLRPHPEGGHYRETWREGDTGGRGAGSAIYFLLAAGQRSAWHRVDADEIWHHYVGAALTLSVSPDAGTPAVHHTLGDDLGAGAEPQLRVPAGWWQAAETTGTWTLVGCTVSPAFEFAGFELAPSGFEPGA
jgi:uncharacterized protein